jgi:hypothetical protein
LRDFRKKNFNIALLTLDKFTGKGKGKPGWALRVPGS